MYHIYIFVFLNEKSLHCFDILSGIYLIINYIWDIIPTNKEEKSMKQIKIKELVLITMLLIVIVINTVDFLKDIQQGDEILHIALEILTVCLSIWGIVMLFRMIKSRKEEISILNKKVEKVESDLELSHSKLKEIGREYNKYITKQFEVWSLTPSEKEVALVLLKGLSFKEIAVVRDTKEKTVRQQASTIYRKSSVAGRHEFSAWFFEDMLI
jgi:DNA-binding CsgD family transcriptional regulator